MNSISCGLAAALGDADELGDKLALGETDEEGVGLIEGLVDELGLIDPDGLGELLTLADGLSEADGEGEGEPISAIAISAHTFTPFVASRSEKVCTQNSYVPAASAGHVKVASLLVSGASRNGESVCTPPGSVTQMRAYCPPGV